MTGDRKKILVVEDDKVLRDTLSDHLGRDYEIVQAEDGEQGLNFILDSRPDLIILDLLLPKLSGLDLLDRVRKYPEAGVAKTKVIIFTNFSNQEFMSRAQELGVAEYLVKTLNDIPSLMKKIQETFG